MNPEFVINGTLAIVGAGLIAAGIVSLVRHKTNTQTVFGGIAAAVGTVMLLIAILTTSVSSVSGPTTSDAGPKDRPIVDNAALVTGKVTLVSRSDASYPWQMAIQVEKIENVGDLPNAVDAQDGQVLTVLTDQNLDNLFPGQEITGTVKLSGNVEGDTFLYLSAIE